jgi:hypothetical protein
MRILPRLVALSLFGLIGAGTAPAAEVRGSAQKGLRTANVDFGADLRACRTAIGGRLDQRRRLGAGQPRVAACLRQRGWNSDGTPSLDRLLAPG